MKFPCFFPIVPLRAKLPFIIINSIDHIIMKSICKVHVRKKNTLSKNT